MNKTVITCLSLFVLAAMGCHGHSTNIKKSVTTSGNDMHIKVSATINGRDLPDYDKTFDITGLSQNEKDSIVKHIMDSLDLSRPKN